jgi:hypothetical protein
MVPKLKAYFAIIFYVAMKKQPNVKCYWKKEPLVFNYLILNNNMAKKRYILMTKYLHIRTPTTYVKKRKLLDCDKME